jgi:hypothetical protein
VYWDIDAASVQPNSCSVTSTNGDSWNGAASGSLGKQSNPIDQQTIFTLTCTALNGAPFRETATASVVPVFREI